MSKSGSGSERRAYKRIPVSVTVRYAPRQFGGDIPPDLLEGRTVDISQSGAALELPHRLRLDGEVELIFMQTHPPGCVSVLGKVVRSVRVPGAVMKDAEGGVRPLHLVALEFSRTLELRELAVLRDSEDLEDTKSGEKDTQT